MRVIEKSLMEERIEHIRKRLGLYLGRLGCGANEQDGIYNLLKIVFYSLNRRFRDGISNKLTINIKGDRNVFISYPSSYIGYIEIIQALSSSLEIAADGNRTILSFTPNEAIFEGFSYSQNIVSDILKSYCYANHGTLTSFNISPEGPTIKELVYNFLSEELTLYLEQNPQVKRQLLSHFFEYVIYM